MQKIKIIREVNKLLMFLSMLVMPIYTAIKLHNNWFLLLWIPFLIIALFVLMHFEGLEKSEFYSEDRRI